ncbi:MAG: hypothetical protein ACI9A1_001168 [Lentimonas sp.]
MLRTLGGAERYYFFSRPFELNNGNIVASHWTGHGQDDSEKGPQLLEFNPEGEVVWSWHDPERGGTIHGVIMLDDDRSVDLPDPHAMAKEIFDAVQALQPLAPISLQMAADTKLESGYQIQAIFDHYMSQQLGEVSGYKMAYASKASQEKWGIDEPVSGTFFSMQQVPSSGAVPLDSFMGFHLETEIAFTIKKPITKQIETVAQLIPYLKSVHVGLDVPDLRYDKSKGKLTAIDVVAMGCGTHTLTCLVRACPPTESITVRFNSP